MLMGVILLMAGCGTVPQGVQQADAEADIAAINPLGDRQQLLEELQKASPNPETTDMVWWMPLQFFETSMAQDPTTREEAVRQIAEVLSPYTIFSATHGKIGAFGGVNWTSEYDLRNNIRLVDAEGTYYKPLSSDEVSPDATSFLGMMQHVLAGLLGKMGENTHFVFFPARTSKGEPIADPEQKGSFSVAMFGETYQWRLPLSSLLPPKACPVDGEQMSGAWDYCPWHGKKLKPVKEEKSPAR